MTITNDLIICLISELLIPWIDTKLCSLRIQLLMAFLFFSAALLHDVQQHMTQFSISCTFWFKWQSSGSLDQKNNCWHLQFTNLELKILWPQNKRLSKWLGMHWSGSVILLWWAESDIGDNKLRPIHSVVSCFLLMEAGDGRLAT